MGGSSRSGRCGRAAHTALGWRRSSSSTCRSDWPPSPAPAPRRESGIRPRRRGLAGPAPSRAASSCSCCPAAWRTTRAGEARDPRRLRRRRRPAVRVRRDRGARRAADAPARPVPAPAFTGAQVAAFGISASFFAMFLYLTLYLQEVLGLSPIEAGLVYLPGTMLMFVVSGATRSRSANSAGRLIAARRRARRRRPGADDARRRRTPPGRRSCPACSSSARHGDRQSGPGEVALGSAPTGRAASPRASTTRSARAGSTVGVAAFGALIPAGAAALAQAPPQALRHRLSPRPAGGAALAVAGARRRGAALRQATPGRGRRPRRRPRLITSRPHERGRPA